MKAKPVIASNFGFRLTELGAMEFIVEDLKGQAHKIIFLPSAIPQLADALARVRESTPPSTVMAADAIPAAARQAARLSEKISKVEHSQSVGYSVAVIPDESMLALRLRQGDGVAAVAALDVPTAQRLIERLQTAIAVVESRDAPKQ